MVEGRRCANGACEPPERRPRRSTPATPLDHYASPLGQQLPCDPTLGALRPCSRPHIAVVDLKGVKPLVGAQLISVDALMEASRVGWSCQHLRDPWLRTTWPGAEPTRRTARSLSQRQSSTYQAPSPPHRRIEVDEQTGGGPESRPCRAAVEPALVLTDIPGVRIQREDAHGRADRLGNRAEIARRDPVPRSEIGSKPEVPGSFGRGVRNEPS